ncbi:AAA family ATPase [Psychrosphaera algicola]|uniref:AAA family ATPase n=1 Tax=Psychrosphaera algicola TaxID=3023714 RepID=UPI00351CC40A
MVHAVMQSWDAKFRFRDKRSRNVSKKLSLENFRSFKSNQISFQQELTILVGENNSGKSNAIDAIRLLTPPL